jgi:hypothetical protein
VKSAAAAARSLSGIPSQRHHDEVHLPSLRKRQRCCCCPKRPRRKHCPPRPPPRLPGSSAGPRRCPPPQWSAPPPPRRGEDRDAAVVAVCDQDVALPVHRHAGRAIQLACAAAAGQPSHAGFVSTLWFKRAAFYNGLKSKVGLAAAKAAALRINLNVQGCGIVATPMHAPSRTPLLLPLLLSHNLLILHVH